MKKLWNKRAWRASAVIFLTLAVIFSVLGEVAQTYAPALNYALKTSSYKVIQSDPDEDNTEFFPSEHPTTADVTAYGIAVSEEAEAEGMVLLKNKNAALPLASGTSVSTVLQTAYSFSYGSSGSGAIDATRYTDLKTALESVGLSVNGTLWDFYAAHPSEQAVSYSRSGDPVYKVNALAWGDYPGEAQASLALTGGTAIAVVGRLSGEGADVSTVKSDGYDGSYLSLTEEEIGVLAALTQMKKAGQLDSIVVLLNTAQIFETAFLDDDWTVTVNDAAYTVDVDACLWIGNVGIGGIFAVAKALVGQVVPSGKLADTYVKDNFSSPAAASWLLQTGAGNFAGKYANSELLTSEMQSRYGVYTEGLYVGYRYYETRYEDTVLGRANVGIYDYGSVVSRPFGYGLSYTTFSYSDFAIAESEDGDYEVTVTVTNTGAVPGKEVVEIYLQKPYTEYDVQMGVEKASIELVGFEKTQTLEPGMSQSVTVSVERESFKTYDTYGCGTYILEPGAYYLAAGTSAHDALNNILALKGKTVADGMDRDGAPSLAALVGKNIAFDGETYAVSAETGAAITDQLGFADINEYAGRGENKVTYVTRSDWAGTFPTMPVELSVTGQMSSDLQSMQPLSENASGEMPTYGAANGLTLSMLRGEPYDSALWDKLLDQMTWEEQSQLVMLAGYGTKGAASVALPELKAEDGPTGVVDSAGSVSFPSEGIWASSFNREVIYRVGDAIAEDARNVGVTGMYLPGVNIHRAPFGGRTHEYYSEDPYLSAEAAASEVRGVQDKGVLVYVKHYAFNDQEDSRIGIGIWLNEQSAREIYLKPFEYAVAPSRGNAHGVMSSFNRAGCVWTSASDALVDSILRGEFGFDGVVLTDMALGQNAYMSYDALTKGTDLFLDPSGAQAQFDGYAGSLAFRENVREAVHRYLYVVANFSAAMNGVSSGSEIVSVSPWWQTLLTLLQVVFFAVGGLSTAAVLYAIKKESARKRTV